MIYEDADQNKGSQCNLGNTYEPPNGWREEDSETYDYLAGSYEFSVLELEVYRVIFD